MENHTCQECRHFVRHYAVVGGQLFEVWCGFCVRARGTHRKPDHRACEAFVEGRQKAPSQEDLTRVLLRYYLEQEKKTGGTANFPVPQL